jgi:hypothetical protein
MAKILSDFKIFFDLETVDLEFDSAFGVIYVKIGSVDFPGKHWRDFSLSIISDWVSLVKKNERPFSLFFYDAYAAIDFKSNQRVELVDDGKVIDFFDVDFDQVVEEIIATANKFINEFQKREAFLGPKTRKELSRLIIRVSGF